MRRRTKSFNAFAALLLGCSGFAYAASSLAAVQALFSPYDDVRNAVMGALDSATGQVLIAHYNIRDQRLLNKLVELQQRGVVVQVVVDEESAGQSWNKGDDFLQNHEVPIARIQLPGKNARMHNKFCIIDRRRVLTGAANWTDPGLLRSAEDLLIIEDQDVTREYQAAFDRLVEEYAPAEN